MMRRTIRIFILLSAVVSSCMLVSRKKTSQKVGEIQFDSIVFNEKIPLLEKVDTLLPYADVKVTFNYPVKFGNKEDLNRLQQIFIGTFFNNIYLDNLSPQEAMSEYIKIYEEDYKSLSNSYYSDKSRLKDGNIPMWYWYYMYLSNKVMFQNDRLLSNAVEYSDYTGGAHGSHMITYTNIDLLELVAISEEDIFAPDYQKPLAEIIVKRLMKQHNVTSPESLIEIGFFNIEDIFPNNNFWLDNEGIHYAFNQYEIAPYVMGVIDVFVPYGDVKGLLKSSDAVERYFGE